MVADPQRDDPIDPNAADPFSQEVVDDPGIETLTDPVDESVPAAGDADATQAELDAAAEREEQLTRLFTATVLGSGDERIGKVGQVYLDDQTQEPNWITVRTGLFGTKEFFIPLDEAQLDGKHIVVPYSKEQVTSAPSTEIDQNLSPDEEDALYNHYRVPGRMTAEDPEAATLAPTTAETETIIDETVIEEPVGDGILGGLAQERPTTAPSTSSWGAPLAGHPEPAPAEPAQPSFAEQSFREESSTWSLAGDAPDAASADAERADASADEQASESASAPADAAAAAATSEPTSAPAEEPVQDDTGSFGIESLFADVRDNDKEDDADDFSAFRRPGQ